MTLLNRIRAIIRYARSLFRQSERNSGKSTKYETAAKLAREMGRPLPSVLSRRVVRGRG